MMKRLLTVAALAIPLMAAGAQAAGSRDCGSAAGQGCKPAARQAKAPAPAMMAAAAPAKAAAAQEPQAGRTVPPAAADGAQERPAPEKRDAHEPPCMIN